MAASEEKKKAPARTRRKADGDGADQRLGRALRSVYQGTVEEDVPDEMMDLLKKLG